MLQTALLLLATGHYQSPAAITYTNNGARVEVVLPELSNLTGLSLRSSPEMAGRVLILRLDRAPVEKSLQRIAEASYGRWVQAGKDRVLVRDTARIESKLAAERAQRIIHIRQGIRIYLTALAKHKNGSSEAQNASDIAAAFVRVATEMDPAPLADLDERMKRVYSTKPKALQHRLPADADRRFRAIVRHERAAGFAFTNRIGQESTRLRELRRPYGKAIVTVNAGAGELWCDVSLYNTKGRVMCDTSLSINLPDENLLPVQPEFHSSPKLEIPPNQLFKDYQLAEDAERAGKRQVSPALKEFLSDPLRHDPVSIRGGQLVGLAKLLNRQLVAAPDDSINGFCCVPPTTLEGVVQSIRFNDLASTGEKDGWIEVREPILYPSYDRNHHADRRRLAAKSPPRESANGSTIFNFLRAKGGGSSEPDMLIPATTVERTWLDQSGEFPLMREITEEQMVELLSGKSYALREMSPRFQLTFAQWSASSLLTPFLEDAPVYDYFADQPVEYETQHRHDDLWQEYTELADSYDPISAKVEVTEIEAPAVAMKLAPMNAPSPSKLSRVPAMPGNIASLELSASVNSYNLPYDKRTLFRCGLNHNYVLKITYASHVYVLQAVTTTTYFPGVPWQLRSDLPKDWATAVTAMEKREIDRMNQPQPGAL